MAKYLNTQELAGLVEILLTNPESLGCLDEEDQFKSFMWDIADVVTAKTLKTKPMILFID